MQDVSLGSVQVGSVPAISNQKVNVDSHVLSQDVDMHAPPIIFRNQDTNDIPITSGTYGLHENHLAHIFNISNHGQQSQYHQQLPVGNLIRDNNRSPFVVDIQSINLGMSGEGGDSTNSGETNDENASLHSHATSFNDQIIDQHKDDDYENEQGEVIQESNAVPQLVSSDQSFSDNQNQIPDYTKPTTKTVYKDSKSPFTQTEANSLVWDKHQSTSELYPVTFTTEHPIDSYTPGQVQTTSANRQPFGTHQLKLQIPSVAPGLVNDMYAPTTMNRTQTPKPISPTRLPASVTRNPNNKHVFIGHHPIDARPSKYGNVGTPHHLTLQNLPVPPHFAGPLFTDPHHSRPPPPPPHHSRRPISINQKPFSRYPVHYNKPIPTNYSLHHGEPIKPNWHSSKPFDSGHYGSNVPLTTTRQPTSTSPHDQTPQTSEINTISTYRPFAKPSLKPDPESTITHYKDPSTNITQAASDSDSDLYDFSRGKPFVFSPQRPTSSESNSASNLNIGEEKRPMLSMKHNKTGELKPSVEIVHTDIFDYKESNNPHNLASITEPNPIETTDNLPGITNAAFVPYGEKIKVPNAIVSAEQTYPKTPATEMQPPPTYTTKFKPYIQKHVQAISPSPHHQNVLIEEVMGLHPPPIPKLSIKQKLPSEIHGNYGKVSIAHNQHAVHKPGQAIFSITAPTHYPDSPTFVTTHRDVYAETSTEADTIQPQIVTNTPEPDVAESEANANIRHPYRNVHREWPTTKETTRTTPESTTPSKVDDLDDYVRYSIDSDQDLPSITTRRPSKSPPRAPSNGHMPQSPHFDENSLLQPSQQHIFTEETSDVWQATQSTPTISLPAETVKATRHTIHDTKVLTVTKTTTKTTGFMNGITSTILLTLTETETSTIVDTITHTLVKPTRVATHQPSIKPTIFTAPVTMHKVMGSKSSIVPNPSYSIYADPHDESEDEHDVSNNSSEDEEDSMLDFDDISHMISPTPKIQDHSTMKHAANSSNDSIFVVMTDRKKLGTINLNADLLHTLTSSLHNTSTKSNENGSKKTNIGALDDVSTEDEDFDSFPKRDEDDNNNDVSHVLLGGILIATPPKSEVSKSNSAKVAKNQLPATYDNNPADEIDEHIESQGAAIIEETRTTHHEKTKITQLECQPDCKAVNNEICQITGDLARCVCRPGFARMFLDRPCKRKFKRNFFL